MDLKAKRYALAQIDLRLVPRYPLAVWRFQRRDSGDSNQNFDAYNVCINERMINYVDASAETHRLQRRRHAVIYCVLLGISHQRHFVEFPDDVGNVKDYLLDAEFVLQYNKKAARELPLYPISVTVMDDLELNTCKAQKPCH